MLKDTSSHTTWRTVINNNPTEEEIVKVLLANTLEEMILTGIIIEVSSLRLLMIVEDITTNRIKNTFNKTLILSGKTTTIKEGLSSQMK